MSFLRYLRQALRSLLHAPGFTLMVVLTLALGLGANIAIFSLIERTLLRPLPLHEPDRLMVVTEFKDQGFDNLSWPDFVDLERSVSSFTGLAAMANGPVNLSGGGEPELLRAGRVTWKFFEVAGVQPLLGRGFSAEEGQQQGPRSVVLSHALWQRRFGGDATLVGRSIRLDGVDVPVVGVMPKGFLMPYGGIGRADLFVPLRVPEHLQQARGAHFLGGIGRLKPGVSVHSARQEVKAFIQQLAQTYPENARGYRGKVVPLQEEVTGNDRPILLTLMGAVVFVLLIACVNVANLLLARSVTRERELSIRAALGADRRQLMAQLLAEAILLALAGAAAGLFLAQVAMKALLPWLPFFSLGPVTLSGGMVVFSLLLALVSVGLFGLLPAWQASRANLESSLREGAKGTGGPAQKRMRRALVTAEVALATLLLAGAGLMIRSLWSLQQVDPGFRASPVLAAGLSLPSAKYPSPESQRGFVRRLLQQAGQAPGVLSLAAVDTLPMDGSTSTSSYQVNGEVGQGDNPSSEVHEITPAFFETMGIPLLRGRTFDAQEGGVVVVSAAFAQRHWPGLDPLGKTVSLGGDDGPWWPIIGVVGNLRTKSLAEVPGPQLFMPMLDGTKGPLGYFTLVTQGRSAPESLLPGLKAALRELDPELPLTNPRPMARILEQGLRESRAKSLLFVAFGLVALLLSSVGVYGVTSYMVTQRTREIGLRMALGAQIRDVVHLILGQGMQTLGLGLLLGLGATWILSHLLQTQLYGISPQDPATLLFVIGILGLIGLLACLIPALRAARVHPSTALRGE